MGKCISPIRWMGSKQSHIRDMHKALPIAFDSIIEGFSGSAALALSLLEAGRLSGDTVFLNDIDKPLMDFWRTLRDDRGGLVDGLMQERFKHGLGSRELFNSATQKMIEPTTPANDLAKAFYINNTLIAVTRMVGEHNYCHPLASSHGLRKDRILDLARFGRLLQGATFTNGDYQKLEPKSVNTLLFLDPPYMLNDGAAAKKRSKGKDERYYNVKFYHARFATWCHRMRDKCQILITYDDNPKHLKSFKGWYIYRRPVFYYSRHEWGTELIITNYEVPFADVWCQESGWEIVSQPTPVLPSKKYEIIYADPPWPYYGNQTKMGAAGNHYKTLSFDEIKELNIKSIVANKAVCFMWATSSTLPYVADVMKEWGFTFNNVAWIWAKTRKDGQRMGAAGVRPTYVKTANHEYLCVGSTKKNGLAPWKGISNNGAGMDQLVLESRLAHSQKPERFRELILELIGDRPRIELFARGVVDGWDAWGKEATGSPTVASNDIGLGNIAA